MNLKRVVLALCWTAVPALAGQSGGSSSHNAASDLDEYCLYTIYTTLSEYTFKGSVTISSSSGEGSTAYGSLLRPRPLHRPQDQLQTELLLYHYLLRLRRLPPPSHKHPMAAFVEV